MTDWHLLRRYKEDASEAAFSQLIGRYYKLVYATCWRELQDARLAEEATLSVFLVLARKAGEFGRGVTLAGWLFKTAKFVCKHALRQQVAERSRSVRWSDAMTQSVESPAARVHAEHLMNDALASLGNVERQAILLRFFGEMSLVEVGRELGLTDEAARKRVARGLDRLRAYLQRHDVALSIAAIELLIQPSCVRDLSPDRISVFAKSAHAALASLPSHSLTVEVLKQIMVTRIRVYALCAAGIACMGAAATFAGGNAHAWPALNFTKRMAAASAKGDHVNDNIIPKIEPLGWGQSGETTFAGSLAIASAVLPDQASYTRVMGDTGLAFRMRWFQPPSASAPAAAAPEALGVVALPQAAPVSYSGVGPTGEWPDEIAMAGKSLGLKMRVVDAAKSDPVKREAVHQEVLASLDEGRPVICYVDPHMDCGLIYGYKGQGKTLVVRDYYPDTKPDQTFDDFGFFFLFLEPGDKPLARKDAVIQGLRAAVKSWSAGDVEHGGGHFQYGAKAFDSWKAALTEVDAGTGAGPVLPNHPNWWTFDSLVDARGEAVKYLQENAALFSAAGKAHIEKAASLYQQEHAAAAKATFENKEAFLGPWTGKKDTDWTSEVRAREIALLDKCQALEADAIAELQKALEAEKV